MLAFILNNKQDFIHFLLPTNIVCRRRSRINGERFPKQQVPSRWAPLRNVQDFFIPKVPFWGFWVVLKNLTNFLITMETSVDPSLTCICFSSFVSVHCMFFRFLHVIVILSADKVRVRLSFFFVSQREFDFLHCKTKTSKYFKCECETLRL